MTIAEQEDAALRTAIFSRLKPDKPVGPDDAVYEPSSAIFGDDDPIALMREHITLSSSESVQFLSGFRGSGKSSELLRLKKLLQDDGYVVLYANALDHLNPSVEINIAEMLVALGLAFNAALVDGNFFDNTHQGYATRLGNFLSRTNISLPGTGTGIPVKIDLKTDPTFRQKLRTALEGRIGDLWDDLNSFVQDALTKLNKDPRAKRGVVFIFDSLEKLRGRNTGSDTVMESIQTLFREYSGFLKLSGTHFVCTVPPWLRFVLPGGVIIRTFCTPRLWKNDASRTTRKPVRDMLRRLIRRRCSDHGFERLFGTLRKDGSSKLADDLIHASGGHFRVLIELLNSVVLRARTFPVDSSVIAHAIAEVRRNFLPIFADDAAWLQRVGLERNLAHINRERDPIQRLTQFLDTYHILYFINGDDWYDLHPLITDEVTRIVTQARETTATLNAAPPLP